MKSQTRSAHARVACSLTLVLAFAASALADDWPQWGGPRRDGVSRESGWTSEGRAKELWRLGVGLGYSSVAVADGRVYTMGYDKEAGLDVVYCLDADTGEALWTHTYPSKIWSQYHTGGTLTTPSVDGGRVYTLNREGSFFCLDAKTGDVLMERKLMEEFEGLETPTWGFSASPLVLEDLIVLNVGRVIALDKKKGEVRWESANYGHAYGTPLEFELDKARRLAVFNGKGLALLSVADGSEHGLFEWKTQYDVNAATPVLVGSDRLFISSGYNKGCAMLQAGPKGLELLWESKAMRTQMSGSILWDGHLYGFDETDLTCIDLQGKQLWSVRDYDNGAVSVADGRLVIINSEGELIVAEASPAGYTELSKVDVIDTEGAVYWSVPVLADGRIYCRSSRGDLVCRDHRGGSE